MAGAGKGPKSDGKQSAKADSDFGAKAAFLAADSPPSVKALVKGNFAKYKHAGD
jgi:hypothetical protein